MVSAQATVTGCGNKTSLHVLIQSYWMNPPFNKAVRFRHISQTIRRAMKGASVFLESWIAGQELTDEQKSKLNDQQKAAAEMPTRTKKCQLSNTRDSIWVKLFYVVFLPLRSPLFENRFVRVMPTPAWSCLSLGRCNWTAWRSLRKRWEGQQ